MKEIDIKSCYIGREISPEQFIPEHLFWFVAKGITYGYDGNKHYSQKAGEYCIIRKNSLMRYNKQKVDDELEKVVVMFDEEFLRNFQRKHQLKITKLKSTEAFIPLQKTKLIPDFICSLMPHYKGSGRIDDSFADAKKEELLFILLTSQPALSGILFDFGKPEKINLEEFMNRNYKFNVSLQRFAYLTGRSLSAFKRDFKEIFDNTPNRWLIQKRLQEAHFLISRKSQKPSEIYFDLGFEDLSHFSYVFKKQFGLTATELADRKMKTSR